MKKEKRKIASVYSAKEWNKIKELASQEGKVYTSAKAAKTHLAEYEDARIAKDRLNDPQSKIISSREIRKIKLTKEVRAFEERRKEPSIPFKQLLKELKKDHKI